MRNSKEATSYSLSNDINLIELDFQVTSDNILVCRHDWSSSTSSVLETTFSNSELIPTYSEFKDCKIYRKYSAIGINDVFDLMKENKDMYVITDTKNTDLETVKLEFGLLVDAARKSNNEALLNRFVVQLYNFDMLDAIDNIYNFPNKLFTIYQIAEPSEEFFEKLGAYCNDNNISVVTIPTDYLWQPFIDIMIEHNLIIYTHTVNSITQLETAINMGVYGIYTDFILPEDLILIEENMPNE